MRYHREIRRTRPYARRRKEQPCRGKGLAGGRKALRPCDARDRLRPSREAIDAIRAGEMIIVVDDEDRENEGDLTIAAEKVTPEAINFMARYGRGLICLPMTGERLDELQIPMMVADQ